MNTPLRNALILAALAACGDTATQPRESTTSDPAPVEAPKTRTITGHEIFHSELVDGTPAGSVPNDLYSTVIEAHFPGAEGFTVVPGYGLSDGTFTIPGAPAEGHYWLRIVRRPFGHDFFWTDASEIDFDTTSLGPLEFESSASSSVVTVSAGGLSPWQEGDRLSWYAPDALNVSDNVANELAEGLPEVGATVIDGLSFDWLGRPAIRVEEGDPAWLVQSRVVESDGGAAYRTPVAALTPAPIHMGTNGAPVEISGTFSSPPSQDVRVAWDREAFEGLATSIHPERTGEILYADGAVSAHPGVREDGSLRFGFEYGLLFLEEYGAMLENDDLGTFAIGNPYPASWALQSFSVTWPVDVPFDFGDDVPRQLEATIAVRSRTLSSDAAPLRPKIAPVGKVRLGGSELDGEVDGVAADAELSIEAPALGEATGYLVQVVEAVIAPPEPYFPGWYLAAQLWLPGDVTSVRMPHGLLQPGSSYVLLVRAFADEGQDLRTKPTRTAIESAFADRVTGVFTVAD